VGKILFFQKTQLRPANLFDLREFVETPITFAEAWTESVSKSSQKFVAFVITVAPIVSCIASTIVLAGVFKLFLRIEYIIYPLFLLLISHNKLKP
jgi:hypothetical protein